MAAAAMAQIHAVLSGRLTVDELIVWCEEADQRWPEVGWKAAALQLRNRPRGGISEKYRPKWKRERKALADWEASGWQSQQRTLEELQRQKESIRGMDGKLVLDEVPF